MFLNLWIPEAHKKGLKDVRDHAVNLYTNARAFCIVQNSLWSYNSPKTKSSAGVTVGRPVGGSVCVGNPSSSEASSRIVGKQSSSRGRGLFAAVRASTYSQ